RQNVRGLNVLNMFQKCDWIVAAADECPVVRRGVQDNSDNRKVDTRIMKSSAIQEPIRGLSKRNRQPSTRIIERAAPAQDPFAQMDKIMRGLLGSGQGPSVTFVYENNETREWAKELHQRM